MKNTPRFIQGWGLISVLLFVVLVLPVLIVGLGQKRASPDTSEASTNILNMRNSHPNFWRVGSYEWTAKKYIWAEGSAAPGYGSLQEYPMTWVWSGPYEGNREVIYQKYKDNGNSIGTIVNDTHGGYKEWEIWKDGSSTAINLSYAGQTPSISRRIYKTYADCLANNPVGVSPWPDVSITQSGIITFYTKVNGKCNDRPDYTAVVMTEDWSTPYSALRTQQCDAYIPISGQYFTNKRAEQIRTNQICKASVSAGVVQQRYASPIENKQHWYGCEATVYAWGNAQSSLDKYKTWFRNGELRYSDWMPIIKQASNRPIDMSSNNNAWWNQNCMNSGNIARNAFGAVPNWYYAGIYRLNNEAPLIDDGK